MGHDDGFTPRKAGWSMATGNRHRRGCGVLVRGGAAPPGRLYSWGLIDCLGQGTVEEVRRRHPPEETAESVSKDRATGTPPPCPLGQCPWSSKDAVSS